MGSSDFLVDLDFPDNGTERGFWRSPVKEILYKMRGIFEAFAKDDWFTYIANLLPLLEDDCANALAYNLLKNLVKQDTSLVLFHRLLIEEFVPGYVQTFTPNLAKAYSWRTVPDDLAEAFFGFSCQRNREVETGGYKDEKEQRQHAAAFIDKELATHDAKDIVAKQSRAD